VKKEEKAVRQKKIEGIAQEWLRIIVVVVFIAVL